LRCDFFAFFSAAERGFILVMLGSSAPMPPMPIPGIPMPGIPGKPPMPGIPMPGIPGKPPMPGIPPPPPAMAFRICLAMAICFMPGIFPMRPMLPLICDIICFMNMNF
jgi:hypothetical protein